MPDSLPLIKGTLDVLVLKALSWGPMHGFDISCWLEDRSDGRLTIDDGALYQAFHRMEERGLITAEWGVSDNNRRARYYCLTTKGRAHLRSESTQWSRYVATVGAILDRRTS